MFDSINTNHSSNSRLKCSTTSKILLQILYKLQRLLIKIATKVQINCIFLRLKEILIYETITKNGINRSVNSSSFISPCFTYLLITNQTTKAVKSFLTALQQQKLYLFTSFTYEHHSLLLKRLCIACVFRQQCSINIIKDLSRPLRNLFLSVNNFIGRFKRLAVVSLGNVHLI